MTGKPLAVALDLSLRSTGWAAVIDGDSALFEGSLRPLTGTVCPSTKGVERLQEIAGHVGGLTAGARIVLIEDYAYNRSNRAHQIGELGGVVRLLLHQRGIPFLEVRPQVGKKLATGAGNASKEEVLAEAVRRLDYRGSSTDEADALWLLQAAAHHYGLPARVDLPKRHLEALEELEGKWPELRTRTRTRGTA